MLVSLSKRYHGCQRYVAGHDAFVVGGTVRDIILGNTPKDVDLITSATLQQVLLQCLSMHEFGLNLSCMQMTCVLLTA